MRHESIGEDFGCQLGPKVDHPLEQPWIEGGNVMELKHMPHVVVWELGGRNVVTMHHP
jgi:hypothetical protein